MFEVTLKEGRRKGPFRGRTALKQPLPVPIASLTELKASDSTWRFYRGKLEDNGNVLIEDKQEIDFVYEMGYFGTVYNSAKAAKKMSRQKSEFLFTFSIFDALCFDGIFFLLIFNRNFRCEFTRFFVLF